MRCAFVFYLVARIYYVVAYSLPPEPNVFEDYDEKKRAYSGSNHVEHRLDFIPPISQNITYIDLRGEPLKQLPYNGFRNVSSQRNISEIMLAHCQISHVAAGALLNLHNLTYIDLSYNDINQIDSKLFSDTKQIEHIYMEHNKIEVVPRGLFQNLILLKGVYLHHNRIHQVERFSFKNTPSLRIIDLNNNQIEFMNMSFKNKFDNFTNLWLDGNPWKCNCELGQLYKFLIKINMLIKQELVCDKPSSLHGKNWSDISRDIFLCRSEVTMSVEDSVMTSTEPVTTTEHDDNIHVTVRNVTLSAEDSVMTSTGPMTTTEHDDYIPVTVHNGTRYQQVDTGIPQAPSHQNWIRYAMLALVLMGVAAVIIGVV